jgi:hypothetical protein
LKPSDFWQCTCSYSYDSYDSCGFIAPKPKGEPVVCPNPVECHQTECSDTLYTPPTQRKIEYVHTGTNEYERVFNDCMCPTCDCETDIYDNICDECGTFWLLEFDPDCSVGERSCDMCHKILCITDAHYMCSDCDFECHPECAICSCNDDKMCKLCAYNMNHKWVTIPAGTGRKLLDVRNRLVFLL